MDKDYEIEEIKGEELGKQILKNGQWTFKFGNNYGAEVLEVLEQIKNLKEA